jgi:hypothetical protein
MGHAVLPLKQVALGNFKFRVGEIAALAKGSELDGLRAGIGSVGAAVPDLSPSN